jgi:AraC family transcriptional regulator
MSPPLPLTVHRELTMSRQARGAREADAQRRAVKELVNALSAPAVRMHPGLAPWQIRQLRVHLDENIGAKITTESLARIAHLSPSHFSRAFSVSFGESPHRYLLQRRMERSQNLMLTTTAAIADIALDF